MADSNTDERCFFLYQRKQMVKLEDWLKRRKYNNWQIMKPDKLGNRIYGLKHYESKTFAGIKAGIIVVMRTKLYEKIEKLLTVNEEIAND